MAHHPDHIPGEDQDELDRVQIEENGEPLVNFLGMSPKLIMSPVHPIFDFPRVALVRKSVAEMLVQAAESLPDELYLSVVEGYRPLSVQKAMFNYAADLVRKEHPDWSEAHIETEAGRRSAPINVPTPPPHLTGGAVDLEIVDKDGYRIDFCSPYTMMDWQQAAPLAPGLNACCYDNRAMLRGILEPTGLTNYVDEWWHWSYGDNGWALRVGAPAAVYGPMDLPKDCHWVGDMSKLPVDTDDN